MLNRRTEQTEATQYVCQLESTFTHWISDEKSARQLSNDSIW